MSSFSALSKTSFPRKRESSVSVRARLGPRDPAPAKAGGGDDGSARQSTFARLIVGLTTFGVVVLTYFGRVRFKGHLPGGLVAIGLGTALSWAIGIAPAGATPPPAAFHLPVPVVGDMIAALGGGHLLPYLSVVVAILQIKLLD
jgi:hypothetical protein